jgi:hypothetical protein
MNRCLSPECARLVCAAVSFCALQLVAADPLAHIEAFRAEMKKQDEMVRNNCENVASVVETELKAGRITPEVARDQSSRLRNLRSRSDACLTGVIEIGPPAAIEVTTAERGAEAVARAWNDLRESVRERDAVRSRSGERLQNDVIASAIECWRVAQSAEDFAKPLEALEIAQHDGQSRGGVQSPMLRASRLNETKNLLIVSQSFLAAFQAQDPGALRIAVQRLTIDRSDRPMTILSPAEIANWSRRFAKINSDRLKTIRKEIEGLIAAASQASPVRAALERFQAAAAIDAALTAGLRSFEVFDPRRDDMPSQITTFFTDWLRVLEATERADWTSAESTSSGMRLPREGLPPDVLKTVAQKRRDVAQQAAAAASAARAAGEKRACERLGAVTDAPSALAVADDFQAERKANPAAIETIDFPSFEADLRQLAALWSVDPAQPNSPLPAWAARSFTPAWNARIIALRTQAVRTQLARRADSPELLQPPLDALPPHLALRRLARDLLAHSEWQRLQVVLINETTLFGANRSPFANDDLSAVRTFITAQNFERAEQFEEAANAYRAVLGFVGECVPVDAAAMRLKTLTKTGPRKKSASSGAGK